MYMDEILLFKYVQIMDLFLIIYLKIIINLLMLILFLMLNLSSIYKRIYKYLIYYNYVEKNGSIYLNKIPVIPYDNNL